MQSRANTFRIAVRKFDPFESAIVKQWESFALSAGISIEVEAVPFDLHPLRQTLFDSGGLKNGEWDAALISTDWIAEAADSRALLDISRSVGADPPNGYPAAWPDSLLRMQSVGGQILGLPYHDGPECLIYRTDLLPDVSQVPVTWDQFREVARRLSRPSANLYGTAFAAFPDGHNTVYDFCLQLWSRGGDLFGPDGQIQLMTTEAEGALHFYRSIVNDLSAVHPQCRAFDSVKAGLAFARGEVALMVNWFGFAAMSEVIEESLVKGRVGIARIPSQGGQHTSLNAYWILGIASGSNLQDIAWRFLKHCASAAMDKLLAMEGAIGCRRSTWRDPDVNAVIPFYRELETLHADARELPRLSCWSELSLIIDEMVTAALNTKMSEQDLLSAAQGRAARLTATAASR